MSNRSISRQSTAQELWDALVDLHFKFDMSQKYQEEYQREISHLRFKLRAVQEELKASETSEAAILLESMGYLRERNQLRAQIVAAAEMCRKLETDADCGGIAAAIWDVLEP